MVPPKQVLCAFIVRKMQHSACENIVNAQKTPLLAKRICCQKRGLPVQGLPKEGTAKKACLKGEAKIKNAFLNKISNPAEGNKTQTNKPVIAC